MTSTQEQKPFPLDAYKAAYEGGASITNFNRYSLKCALNGDVSDLSTAFHWGSMPERREYWKDIWASEELTPDARQSLESLLAYADREDAKGGGA